MNGDLERIRLLLAAARRRWFWHTVLAAVARALVAAMVIVLAAWVIVRAGSMQAHAASAGALAASALVAVAVSALWAAWPLRRRPTDAQVARFVEEHCPHLEDRLATAVESASNRVTGGAPVFAELLYRDAARRIEGVDLDETISRRAVKRRALSASTAALGLIAVIAIAWPDIRAAMGALGQAAFPPQVAIRVSPGDARVIANNSFTVRARIDNIPPGVRPVLTVDDRHGHGERVMTAVSQGEFTYTFPQVFDPFRYAVRAHSSGSSKYTVAVINPARVTRIDVHYEYPAGYGVASRVEEDGGDLYGPPGTRVQLSISTDKPVRDGVLALDDGTAIALARAGDRRLTGDLKITDDGSYRVALTDREGLRNPGETEYFIRVLADSPPDVRIVKPAADRQVTPLEEVPIAAHADDDHGVKDFDLVYSVRGGPEQRLPFAVHGDARSLDGTRVIYLEDLHVRPGDFVTYYARARDNAPGKASGEARSDIFFLEVTAFDDEFAMPQSQASSSGGVGSAGRSLEDLIRAQKAIVVATWKLDRRSRRSRSSGSEDDVRTVARAQGELKKRTIEAGGATIAPSLAKGSAGDGGDAMTNAVEAMGQAEESLNAARTSDALPHETRALNELMRAQAGEHRKQLMQASGNGSGGDAGNSNADLSTMFDRALQREQKTNYELPQNQARQDRQQNDVMDRLRQLAERQGELSQRQQDLDRQRAQMQPDEFKRQLERLTREQSDLRQQAEQLADQMRSKSEQQATGQAGPGQRQAAASAKSGDAPEGAMRKASESMREAAARLRDGKLGEAGRQGQQALGNLQSAEDAMRRRQSGDDAASSLGDLQMQARRAAGAQREIAGQLAAAGSGPKATDAMRRIAGQKERLADQVERLQKDLKGAAASAALQGHQREALQGASVDLERLQLPKQMRDAAAAMRDPSKGDVNRPESAAKEEDLAKTLDGLASRVAGVSASRDASQASDRLARTQDIKDHLAQLERQMNELQRQGGGPGQPSKTARAGERGQRAAEKPVGTGGGDSAARLEQLREEYQRELRQAAEHLEDLRRAGVGTTPEGQGQQILSARGYNQDFSEWQQLSHGINAGLDRAETELSQKLRDQQARDRLQAPSAGRAPEQYRRLVEEYYQALAGKARKQ